MQVSELDDHFEVLWAHLVSFSSRKDATKVYTYVYFRIGCARMP